MAELLYKENGLYRGILARIHTAKDTGVAWLGIETENFIHKFSPSTYIEKKAGV